MWEPRKMQPIHHPIHNNSSALESTIISQWRRPFTQNCESICLVMRGKAQTICWCDCIISWESPSFMAAQISSNLKLIISCSTLQGEVIASGKIQFYTSLESLPISNFYSNVRRHNWQVMGEVQGCRVWPFRQQGGHPKIRKWRACLTGTVVGGAKIKTLITWVPGRAHSYLLLQYIFYRRTDSRDRSNLDQICFCFIDFPWNMQLL